MDWVVIAACFVGVLSAARLTRLVVQDSFPPSAWLRIQWDRLTEDGPWQPLLHCHWCLAPWVAAVVLATALIWDLHPAWWVINGWLGGAYLASMVVERDEVVD